jgi:lipid-A-disaccharide synthase
MLVAAEASGDALGAGLARALKAKLDDHVRFVGVGGPLMAREGVESPFSISELSILGIFEGVRALPRVQRRAQETAELARRERPDVAVLIDSWGFTLRVAQRLRRADPGLPLIKYVGPQVWASRPGRAKTLARTVDRLLSIHAFDAPYFEGAGLPTRFVGNPALARDFSHADPARLRAQIGAEEGDRILLVMPGSRPSEVERLIPPFSDAIRRLKPDRPDLRVVIPVASTVADQVKALTADWPGTWPIEDEQLKTDAMRAGTVALVCSGTATTELALAGCPMVVAYRVGPLTYRVLRRIVTARFITLFNIAADRAVAPELIQDDCNGPALARELALRLDDPALRARQAVEQTEVLGKMGRGGDPPSERAAEAVLEVLRERGRL